MRTAQKHKTLIRRMVQPLSQLSPRQPLAASPQERLKRAGVVLHRVLPVFVAALLMSGCEPVPDDEQSMATIETPTQTFGANIQAATDLLWQRSPVLVEQTLQAAENLQLASNQLVATPSPDTLALAQQTWRITHHHLLQMNTYFALGSISPDLFKQLDDARFLLDATPIEPGYLDYFDVYLHSGIVNDIAIPIRADTIRQQHGFSSDSDVALGMHAIEYLLWGEQGNRPISDFITAPPSAEQQAQGLTGEDLPQQRRTALLQLQITLLIDELKALHYKLAHPASGLNQAYFNLPTGSRIQLWRQALIQVSHQLKLHASEASIDHHSLFASDTASALALCKSLEVLLKTTSVDASPSSTDTLQTKLIPNNSAAFMSQLAALIALLQPTQPIDETTPEADVLFTETYRSHVETLLTLLPPKPLMPSL